MTKDENETRNEEEKAPMLNEVFAKAPIKSIGAAYNKERNEVGLRFVFMDGSTATLPLPEKIAKNMAKDFKMFSKKVKDTRYRKGGK